MKGDKKLMRIKYLVLSAVLCLAACADVPDDVISRNNEREAQQNAAQTESKENEKIDFIDGEAVRADADEAIKMKLSNFTLRDGISVDLPKEFIHCDFVHMVDRSEEGKRLSELFFSEEELSKVNVEKHSERLSDVVDDENRPDPNIITSSGFHSEEAGLHFYVWDNGFICYMKPQFIVNFGDGTVIKEYNLDLGDDLSDKYTLSGKEVTVAAAAEKGQEWLDQIYKRQIEPEYDYKIKRISVVSDDLGELSFHLYACKVYNGVEIDSLCVKALDGVIYREVDSMELITADGSEFGWFSTGDGPVSTVLGNKVSQIVSLSSALKYIEKTFTDFDRIMTIDEINLIYTVSPQYDTESGMRYDSPGTKCTGSLAWEFVIDAPASQKSKNSENCKYILIDAETGELDYQFDN